MAAGAVPVVLEIGGPAATVRNKIDGVHWGSLEELINATVFLIEDQEYLEELKNNAQQRALSFDRRVFDERVKKVFSENREKEKIG